MRISLEQQGLLNKARCTQLKDIRKNMAAELGISLNQSDCQNKSYCNGTCPKCQAEERLLNDAIEIQKNKVFYIPMEESLSVEGNHFYNGNIYYDLLNYVQVNGI